MASVDLTFPPDINLFTIEEVQSLLANETKRCADIAHNISYDPRHSFEERMIATRICTEILKEPT